MVQLVVAPERSLQQRLDALERANDVRLYRAQMKRDIKAGKRCPRAVLAAPGELVETMKVVDLLLAMPRVGRVKAHKVLGRARVSPSKTLGGLTERQRLELLSLLGPAPQMVRAA
jgi:hypothetical protein